MSRASIKSWYLVHKWTSLICTVFMLLLGLTGLPLIFHHEIDHALGYSVDPPALPESAQRASLDGIVADAKARRPDDAVQFVVRDPGEPDIWFVRLGATVDAPGASAFYTYDARTGAYLHEYPLNQGVMNVLLRLHVDMFAGLPGTLFLGLMGLLLAASLVSGVAIYGPFKRKLRFGTVRHGQWARLKWLDLHNLLGIVTLVWFLVVGVTGVINTLAIPIFGQWQATELAEMTAPYRDRPPLAELGSVDQALAAARAAAPGMALSFMAFPGNSFTSPHHFVAFMQGTTPWTSKLLKPALIDAQTGRVIETREMPWYVTALLISQPLHFGDYGGLPLKVLWGLLDLIAIVMLGSGLYLWWVKRNVAFETGLNTAQCSDMDDVVPRVSARQGSET
ncbi:MAG: PepSY-associated TM helix domain-containing protein [Gammaproteobacteria bacterium]